MSTTHLDLKVTADAHAAVQGLKPLSAALDGVTKDADQTESALKDLDRKHKIDLNDEAIAAARKEISRLRTQMRDDLRLDINADTRAAQKRIRELTSTVKTLDAESIDITATVQVDEASVSRLSSLQTSLSGLEESTGGMVPGLGSLAGNLGKLGGAASKAGPALAAVAVVAGGWKLGEQAADVETMVVQLDALTKGKGAATMKDLQHWAALTPFAIEDATEATKKLVAAGVPLQNIPDYLNDIGNVAAATGVPIDQLGTVFAQMESSGKAQFENLQQIAEAGVPVWATLADQLGMTTAEVQKLATEGRLGADAIELARKSLGDLYPTAMQTQAETFNGQMSTFNDNLSQIGSTLGSVVLPFMSQLMGDVNELAGGLLSLSGKVADLGAKWQESRKWMAESTSDGKTDLKDLMDIASQPGILSIGRSWDAVKEAFGHENTPADAVKEVGETAEETAKKVADAAFDQKAALKAAADAAKVYEQRLKDAITAFGQIGGNVRTKVSFIISQDDLQEQIDKAVKGEKGKKGIELPAKITLSGIADLSDQQQDLVGLISSSVETGLQEGSRRAEINPNFDSAAWYQQVREKTRGQLVEVGIDKSHIDQVLTDVFGLPKKVTVTTDITKAQADVNSLSAPQTVPLSVQTTITGPWAPGKGPAANFFAPQSVPVTPTIKDAKPAADQLAAVTKPRDAVIVPALDQSQIAHVRSVLDDLARDRYSTIHVTTKTTGGAGGGGGGTGPGGSIVPQLFGTDTATIAGLRAAAAQVEWMSSSGTGRLTQQQPANASAPTQLAPRQVPIKVYLDGAEIADHLTLKAGRLATASSVRRRA